MAAAAAAAEKLWEVLAEYTAAAEAKGVEAPAWAAHLSSALAAAGIQLPSPEIAGVLVSRLCWAHHDSPLAWKYLDRAISAGLAPPMLVLALLSSKLISSRHAKPVAYRLYMELLRRHAFSFASQIKAPSFKMTMASVDDALRLSQTFGIQACEPGVLVVEFVFCIVWQLVDATLDDEGLKELALDKKSNWECRSHEMEVDEEGNFDEKQPEYNQRLVKANSLMAIELVAQFLQHKLISQLLCLASENMPSHWEGFVQCLHLLVTNSSVLRSSTISPEKFQQLLPDNRSVFCRKFEHMHYKKSSVIAAGSLTSPGGYCHGASSSVLWVPIDLYLEDCIDGTVAATNAVEILSGLVKSLKAMNETSWHDAFLGLWIASLRLVQRERDPHEGPVPRLDSRLCMLLSITTLSVADIIEEEVNLITEMEHTYQWKEKALGGKRRRDLISSLQMLGDYESLLSPPSSVVSAANQAAAKAVMFVSGFSVGSGCLESININDKAINCGGNLRHLIVEACISRNLLDTSSYLWPGYTNGRINQIPHTLPGQVPGWSAFMKGAPLTSSMIAALVATPASSLAELEKVYETAVNGSENDRISAAMVLCGASLVRGWNIQEHTVRFVVRLLSPSVPDDYTGSDNYLISHGPMLNVILTGISSVDCVQVFSFHGLVPELAGSLMAICEVFGSCLPSITWTLPTGEEVSGHAVFSNAFILLLRLWKFNHPPLEYCVTGDGSPVGSQLTPEYLLLLRNSRVQSSCKVMKKLDNHKRASSPAASEVINPIFVDSFPKLKFWYRQHQACLASTLSGLVPGTPVHQNVDGLLNMMFRKMNNGSSQTVGPGTSGNHSLSSSSGQGSEDNAVRPNLPAWEIMEAVPYVVDAALTACSHGRLSPRELATGLKDLADFLPAALATIVSYFSAEVTRGVWKPAFMNGTDWPSPAANLSTVEEHIKKIVAATGVDVPSLVAGGSSQATLPLPLAAFVSLTITYKLDKASERFLNLAGPALESLAASCPWPSMPIVGALWTQKVKRWSDFLIFSASRTVFHHNKNAVVQLLRSCFSVTLGLSSEPIFSNGGIGKLLGHGFGSHCSGGLSPVAPGILYLRIYRCINDIVSLTEEIMSLLMDSVKEIAESVLPKEKAKKTKYGMRYGQVSLAAAMTQVKVAAELGATFVWLSGGSAMVQLLFHEMLPSWFLLLHKSDQDGGGGGRGRAGGVFSRLGGRALAYFAVFCGMFAWGINSTPLSKRRQRVIEAHMDFLAGVLDGKILLGCDWALWQAYVSCFLGLIAKCTPSWVAEVDLEVLKRLSRGLKQRNEDELALALLRRVGVGTMGTAAELILSGE